MKSKLALIAAALATTVAFTAVPAQAQHWHGGHGGWHGGGWHRGGGWGWGGAAAGFATGALIGGALASGPYYGYGYGPGYYDGGYDDYAYDAPGPVVVERSGGGSVAYCEQRFRSYDPSSGTYLGYDGMRHPCP